MIFFGSRVGNSLLLRLHEKPIIDPTSIDTIETMNGDEIETTTTTDLNLPSESIEESGKKNDTSNGDGEFVTGTSKNEVNYFASEQGTLESKKQTVTYSLEVADHLINIGPCGYAIVGEGDSEETRPLQRHMPAHYQTAPLDLVTTSGTSKCGSVSILQQTIKPELITTQALPNSVDMWTVYASTTKQNETRQHAYILIGQEISTLIFQTGVDITELEQGGFLTNEQTIYCGNNGEQYIVQVTRLHVVLLRDSQQIENISYENTPIRSATSLDRYLTILTTQGAICVYTLVQDESDTPKLREHYRLNDKRYTSMNLYIDHSGLFTTATNNNLYGHSTPSKQDSSQQLATRPSTTNPLDSTDFAGGGDDDDEDEWLYGGKPAEKSLAPATDEPMDSSDAVPGTETLAGVSNQNSRVAPTTRWLMTINRDGTLALHELLTDDSTPATVRFEIARFNSALKILVDVQDTSPSMTNYLGKIETSCSATVYELLMIGLGVDKDRVHLVARIDEDLILYEAFPYAHAIENRLKLRFRRVTCNALLRTKKSSAKKNAAKKQKDAAAAAAQLQQNQNKATTENNQEVRRESRNHVLIDPARVGPARSRRSP